MATRRIKEFLEGNKVKYVLVSHSPAYSSQEVAASVHMPGKQLAKTVIVKLDGRLAMAVVPATRDVEMSHLRRASGVTFAELAATSDFVERFEGCQLGSMPPFGNLFGMETYVEKDLAKEEYIAFNAGTHTDAIIMPFVDYRRLAKPKLEQIATQQGVARVATALS